MGMGKDWEKGKRGKRRWIEEERVRGEEKRKRGDWSEGTGVRGEWGRARGGQSGDGKS